MIYALFYYDTNGFPLVEIFTLEFKEKGHSKLEIYDQLGDDNEISDHYNIGNIKINFFPFDNKYLVGIITDREDPIDKSVVSRLIEIGHDVIKGDKIAIQKIMNIRRSIEIEFI